MGLDMYVNATRFLWSNDDLTKKINDKMRAIKIPGLGDMDIKRIECEAIYWRKANAIHKWFVDNAQEGQDDCGHYDIDLEQLKELADLCRAILADRSLAGALLPPQAGFFFGTTELDEWYFKDLEHTVESVDKLLATPKIQEWDFVYHSSW